MSKIKLMLNKLYQLCLGIFIMFVFAVIILFPYSVASKDSPGIIFFIYGLFFYVIIVLLTIEQIVAVFGILYDVKRKTILFSPNFKDGTPKPKSEKPTVGIKVSIIALSYFFIIHIYAVTYLFIGNHISKSFDKEKVVLVDAIFLSFTTITVGPSGMEPSSAFAKVLVMTEIFWGLIYSIFVFSLVVSLIDRQETSANKDN